MTEEEAKTKWCPFTAPIVAIGSAPLSRLNNTVTLCLGEQCMAWKWESKTQGQCGFVKE